MNVAWSFRNYSNMLFAAQETFLINVKTVVLLFRILWWIERTAFIWIFFIIYNIKSLLINLMHNCWISVNFFKKKSFSLIPNFWTLVQIAMYYELLVYCIYVISLVSHKDSFIFSFRHWWRLRSCPNMPKLDSKDSKPWIAYRVNSSKPQWRQMKTCWFALQRLVYR